MGWWADRRQRSHERAIARQDRGYRASWRRLAVAVPADDWVSQFDAAERLGVSVNRVGLRLYAGFLEPAENPVGQAGVTKRSLEHELEWRRTASRRARLWRVISYWLRSI